jgi:hypothetical protein
MKRTKSTGKSKNMATVNPPRKVFALELMEKLKSLNIGKVTCGELSDKSSFWIDLKIKNKTLEFSFECDYETIHGLSVCKNIKQVVDQKKIFGK